MGLTWPFPCLSRFSHQAEKVQSSVPHGVNVVVRNTLVEKRRWSTCLLVLLDCILLVVAVIVGRVSSLSGVWTYPLSIVMCWLVREAKSPESVLEAEVKENEMHTTRHNKLLKADVVENEMRLIRQSQMLEAE